MGTNSSLRMLSGPRTSRSSSVTPPGAWSSNRACCCLVNSCRTGLRPRNTLRSTSSSALAFIRAEHTKPPGMASTSTPNPGRRRTSSASSDGTTGRSLTTESPVFRCSRRALNHESLLVQPQIRSVEVGDLSDLRAHGIHPQSLDHGSPADLRNSQLQFDRVRSRQEGQDLAQLCPAEGGCRCLRDRVARGLPGGPSCPWVSFIGHHPSPVGGLAIIPLGYRMRDGSADPGKPTCPHRPAGAVEGPNERGREPSRRPGRPASASHPPAP